MAITFDPAKRDWTLANRYLDFLDAVEVFDGRTYDTADTRFDYGETRILTIGRLRGRMIVVVWTLRGETRHIISMRKANIESKHATKSTSIDPDEAPELTDEWFQRADQYDRGKLVKRGRPKSGNPKQAISLRVDADVLEKWKETGPGWQIRMNEALRKAVGL